MLKVNTEAENGAGVKLFIEIPWCGLSIRSQQSLESSNCAGPTLCPLKSPDSLPVGPVGCWTLAWEVKLWKPDVLWLVNRALWRCHTESSQCPSLSSVVAWRDNYLQPPVHRNPALKVTVKQEKKYVVTNSLGEKKNILCLRVSTCIRERRGFFADQHANVYKMN